MPIPLAPEQSSAAQKETRCPEAAGLASSLFAKGWCRFAFDPVLFAWVQAALPAARESVRDPANAEWLRHGGTWFAGVHVLPNDASGALDGVPPIAGVAIDFIRDVLGDGDPALRAFDWDRGQVSVCYPGYPQQDPEETESLHRYRVKRDAAHLDGLLREGPDRRRHLREYHGFVLGLPMVEADPGAAPFSIWEGSHEMMRSGFREIFRGIPPEAWAEQDVTEAYQALRREIFDACPRVEIAARPGEAYLVHRLALHGVAPWRDGAEAGPDGRMILYFRPPIGGPAHWLEAP